MVCDATNGYCSKFQLYTGKKCDGTVTSSYGATYDLVMSMMRGFFGKGHVLYMDNYYSSPRLYWDLWQQGIRISGLLRPNCKGVPQMHFTTRTGF